MKLNLTKNEIDAVQYAVWLIAVKKAPNYKKDLLFRGFSIEKLYELWKKIAKQMGGHK